MHDQHIHVLIIIHTRTHTHTHTHRERERERERGKTSSTCRSVMCEPFYPALTCVCCYTQCYSSNQCVCLYVIDIPVLNAYVCARVPRACFCACSNVCDAFLLVREQGCAHRPGCHQLQFVSLSTVRVCAFVMFTKRASAKAMPRCSIMLQDAGEAARLRSMQDRHLFQGLPGAPTEKGETVISSETHTNSNVTE